MDSDEAVEKLRAEWEPKAKLQGVSLLNYVQRAIATDYEYKFDRAAKRLLAQLEKKRKGGSDGSVLPPKGKASKAGQRDSPRSSGRRRASASVPKARGSIDFGDNSGAGTSDPGATAQSLGGSGRPSARTSVPGATAQSLGGSGRPSASTSVPGATAQSLGGSGRPSARTSVPGAQGGMTFGDNSGNSSEAEALAESKKRARSRARSRARERAREGAKQAQEEARKKRRRKPPGVADADDVTQPDVELWKKNSEGLRKIYINAENNTLGPDSNIAIQEYVMYVVFWVACDLSKKMVGDKDQVEQISAQAAFENTFKSTDENLILFKQKAEVRGRIYLRKKGKGMNINVELFQDLYPHVDNLTITKKRFFAGVLDAACEAMFAALLLDADEYNENVITFDRSKDVFRQDTTIKALLNAVESTVDGPFRTPKPKFDSVFSRTSMSTSVASPRPRPRSESGSGSGSKSGSISDSSVDDGRDQLRRELEIIFRDMEYDEIENVTFENVRERLKDRLDSYPSKSEKKFIMAYSQKLIRKRLEQGRSRPKPAPAARPRKASAAAKPRAPKHLFLTTEQVEKREWITEETRLVRKFLATEYADMTVGQVCDQQIVRNPDARALCVRWYNVCGDLPVPLFLAILNVSDLHVDTDRVPGMYRQWRIQIAQFNYLSENTDTFVQDVAKLELSTEEVLDLRRSTIEELYMGDSGQVQIVVHALEQAKALVPKVSMTCYCKAKSSQKEFRDLRRDYKRHTASIDKLITQYNPLESLAVHAEIMQLAEVAIALSKRGRAMFLSFFQGVLGQNYTHISLRAEIQASTQELKRTYAFADGRIDTSAPDFVVKEYTFGKSFDVIKNVASKLKTYTIDAVFANALHNGTMLAATGGKHEFKHKYDEDIEAKLCHAFRQETELLSDTQSVVPFQDMVKRFEKYEMPKDRYLGQEKTRSASWQELCALIMYVRMLYISPHFCSVQFKTVDDASSQQTYVNEVLSSSKRYFTENPGSVVQEWMTTYWGLNDPVHFTVRTIEKYDIQGIRRVNKIPNALRKRSAIVNDVLFYEKEMNKTPLTDKDVLSLSGSLGPRYSIAIDPMSEDMCSWHMYCGRRGLLMNIKKEQGLLYRFSKCFRLPRKFLVCTQPFLARDWHLLGTQLKSTRQAGDTLRTLSVLARQQVKYNYRMLRQSPNPFEGQNIYMSEILQVLDPKIKKTIVNFMGDPMKMVQKWIDEEELQPGDTVKFAYTTEDLPQGKFGPELKFVSVDGRAYVYTVPEDKSTTDINKVIQQSELYNVWKQNRDMGKRSSTNEAADMIHSFAKILLFNDSGPIASALLQKEMKYFSGGKPDAEAVINAAVRTLTQPKIQVVQRVPYGLGLDDPYPVVIRSATGGPREITFNSTVWNEVTETKAKNNLRSWWQTTETRYVVSFLSKLHTPQGKQEADNKYLLRIKQAFNLATIIKDSGFVFVPDPVKNDCLSETARFWAYCDTQNRNAGEDLLQLQIPDLPERYRKLAVARQKYAASNERRRRPVPQWINIALNWSGVDHTVQDVIDNPAGPGSPRGAGDGAGVGDGASAAQAVPSEGVQEAPAAAAADYSPRESGDPPTLTHESVSELLASMEFGTDFLDFEIEAAPDGSVQGGTEQAGGGEEDSGEGTSFSNDELYEGLMDLEDDEHPDGGGRQEDYQKETVTRFAEQLAQTFRVRLRIV